MTQKGNKRKAQQELIRIRSKFEIPPVAGELSPDLLFADYLDQWLDIVRTRVKYNRTIFSSEGSYFKRIRSSTYSAILYRKAENS